MALSPVLGLHLLFRWASPCLSKCPHLALHFSLCLVRLGALFPPRFLAMLLSKALRSLCFQTIYYKLRSLPERWEGRRSAALRFEEALELTQEFLASWFICPQRHLLSHFSDWPACKLSPNSSQGKWKREENQQEQVKKEIPKVIPLLTITLEFRPKGGP